tara:strand:+ start:447 stop:899 length:453 start_codon:yes stop_codon:yes gene_type:complete
MRKNIILTLIALTISGLAFSSTVNPTISMRFNDVTGDPNAGLAGAYEPSLVIGLALALDAEEDGPVAGFDSDGFDHRIFIAYDYGSIGLGMNANGDPQFTVGANYSTLNNLTVSLDYIINNLARDVDANGDPIIDTVAPNEIRLSLGVTF